MDIIIFMFLISGLTVAFFWLTDKLSEYLGNRFPFLEKFLYYDEDDEDYF